MNRDDIIRMALEADGFEYYERESDDIPCSVEFSLTDLATFVALVAAHEREACARLCEGIEMQGHALWKRTYDPDAQGRSTGAADCAAAIRARGEA